MVAAPLSYASGHGSGPRPINLRRDVPQILALLNLVFAGQPGNGGQSLNRLSLSQEPWFVSRLRQLSNGLTPGYVWEESGSIVGNVSILTSNVRGRYLVANVAVHPDFRRQGIARSLMETVVQTTRNLNARELLLQVKTDNEGAIRLYEGLGFERVGSVTSWYSSFNQFRLLPAAVSGQSPDHSGEFFIRPLRGNEWQKAYALDTSVVDADLVWPEPTKSDQYKGGFLRWFEHMISGRKVETWVAEAQKGQMVGVATVLSEWGRYHTLDLRVLPQWSGAQQPLLAKLLRRVQHSYRRNIRIDHPADDQTATGLLQRANFVPRYTLTTMRLIMKNNGA